MYRPLALAGSYGDLFWSLESSTAYIAGDELTPRIYVANTTAVPHEYMLMARALLGTKKLLEFPVPVEGASWFIVEPGDIASLVGSMKVNATNATLRLDLYERESNAVTDSVSTVLTLQPAYAGLPGLPGTTDLLSTLITMMIVIMMMSMMVRMVSGKEEKKRLEDKGRQGQLEPVYD